MTNEAEALMEDHNQQMADLAEKYIGKNEMNRGLTMTDLWFKKQWYIYRIKELMQQAGRCNERRRRCKPDSPKWTQYDTAEIELELLADNLALDLLSL